jgi:hypothetical protein
MWEIIASKDFLANLLAGSVFFVLELWLLVLLLPRLVQERLDHRWRIPRKSLCLGVARCLQDVRHHLLRMSDLNKSGKKPSYLELSELSQRPVQDLMGIVQTYNAAMTPEMAENIAFIIHYFKSACRSMASLIGAKDIIVHGVENLNEHIAAEKKFFLDFMGDGHEGNRDYVYEILPRKPDGN